MILLAIISMLEAQNGSKLKEIKIDRNRDRPHPNLDGHFIPKNLKQLVFIQNFSFKE